MDACTDACRDLGSWAQLAALLMIGARWGWAEIARRRAADTAQAQTERMKEAQAQVVALQSIRPPPMPSLGAVTLQIQAAPVEAVTPIAESGASPTTPRDEGPIA